MRLLAVSAAAFVGLSFLLFAVEQSGEGSANQVRALEGTRSSARSDRAIARPAPVRAAERLREARHGATREGIDDVNDVLVSPFVGLVRSGDVWVERIVPAALGLLLYGLGGMLLANFLPKPARQTTDWREATS